MARTSYRLTCDVICAPEQPSAVCPRRIKPGFDTKAARSLYVSRLNNSVDRSTSALQTEQCGTLLPYHCLRRCFFIAAAGLPGGRARGRWGGRLRGVRRSVRQSVLSENTDSSVAIRLETFRRRKSKARGSTIRRGRSRSVKPATVTARQ